MSDGKTHDDFTQKISILPPLLIGGWYWWVWDTRFMVMGLLAWAGCQLQRYYSPDVDVDTGFYGLYIAKKNWGYILGYIWVILIFPFRFISHRHWLTHGPVIGSLVRLGYLYLLYFLITRFTPELFIPITFYNFEYFLVFFLGFLFGDLGHLWLDRRR